jgi:hypothetical protein
MRVAAGGQIPRGTIADRQAVREAVAAEQLQCVIDGRAAYPPRGTDDLLQLGGAERRLGVSERADHRRAPRAAGMPSATQRDFDVGDPPLRARPTSRG